MTTIIAFILGGLLGATLVLLWYYKEYSELVAQSKRRDEALEELRRKINTTIKQVEDYLNERS